MAPAPEFPREIAFGAHRARRPGGWATWPAPPGCPPVRSTPGVSAYSGPASGGFAPCHLQQLRMMTDRERHDRKPWRYRHRAAIEYPWLAPAKGCDTSRRHDFETRHRALRSGEGPAER